VCEAREAQVLLLPRAPHVRLPIRVRRRYEVWGFGRLLLWMWIVRLELELGRKVEVEVEMVGGRGDEGAQRDKVKKAPIKHGLADASKEQTSRNRERTGK
jgi:hypothetical protein